MGVKDASEAKLEDLKDEVTKATKGDRSIISNRGVTGVLASHAKSRDVKIDQVTLTLHGKELIQNSSMDLQWGKRYGLIGMNGCGKSTLLKAIGARELPIPEFMDIHLLDGEVPATDLSALEAVLEDVKAQTARLETLAEKIVEEDPESDLLTTVYENIDALDPDLCKTRAGEILHGLGFDKDMQNKATKDFSGGWRMRIALAKALFKNPMILLLDEPTNHLDLNACVWLEEYLKSLERILIIVSHSQDFMNNVCTNIILMRLNNLTFYQGNYDVYVKTRAQIEEHQMKKYWKEQEQIKDYKEYIARFGHGTAKNARQAQSREKKLNSMLASGLTDKVTEDKVFVLRFADCGKLPPPVMQFNKVSFMYPGTEKKKGALAYTGLEFGIDLDTRVALVGPNGAGKSTLLKLMSGDLSPTDGVVRRHQHLKIAFFHQHLAEKMDMELSPVQFLMTMFPECKEIDTMRKAVGRFGITGKAQMSPMKILSDGQVARVVFAWLAWKDPHLLILDEPTNHLDMETIDALAEAINEFEGGLVLVSHDFRLIDQVAKEIWLCDGGKIERIHQNIHEYKELLRQQMLKNK